VDPDLVLRRDLVSGGFTDDELARLVRRGELFRLRRGAYVVDGLPLGEADRHRLLVVATLRSLRRPAVVSHQSAAVLLGLPVWGVGLTRVHVTRQPPASSELGPYLRTHVARLRDDEVTTVDGVLVTDPVRTLLDLARSQPFEPSVTALDAALFRKAVSAESLTARLADIAGTSGSRAAARAVAFADGRSESVGESRSRVLFRRLGLPPVHPPAADPRVRRVFAGPSRFRLGGRTGGRGVRRAGQIRATPPPGAAAGGRRVRGETPRGRHPGRELGRRQVDVDRAVAG
jgi:hypothetical protein